MSDAPAILTVLVTVAGGWALMAGSGPDLAANAENQPANAPTATDRRIVVLSQAKDGYFYAEAKVNGAPVRFIIDTGANTTVLLKKDAEKAGLSALGPVSLRTAGKDVAAMHARIARLEIGRKTVQDLPAVIVDGGIHTSLIGTNALSKLGSVRLSGATLQLD